MSQRDELTLARGDERDAGICLALAAAGSLISSGAVFAVIYGFAGAALAAVAAAFAFAGRTKRAIAWTFLPMFIALASIPINLAQIGGTGSQLLASLLLGSVTPFVLLAFGIARLRRAERRRHHAWAVQRKVTAGPPTPFARRPVPPGDTGGHER